MPYLHSGPKQINVDEWEPIIRTMPHAEYPSGSSCVCKAYTETLKMYFGNAIVPPSVTPMAAGASKNSPGLRPASDVSSAPKPKPKLNGGKNHLMLSMVVQIQAIHKQPNFF